MELSDALTSVGVSFVLSLGAAATASASPATPAPSATESATAPQPTWQSQVKQGEPLWMSLLEEAPAADLTDTAAMETTAARPASAEAAEAAEAATTDAIAPVAEGTDAETEIPIDVEPPAPLPEPEEAPALETEPFTDPDTTDTTDTSDDIGDEIAVPGELEGNPDLLNFPTAPEDVVTGELQPVTLQQAVAIAERNNPELTATRLELDRRLAALREQQAALYPRLSAGSDLTLQEGQQQQQISRIDPQTGRVEFEEAGDDVDVLLGGNVRIDYDIFTSGRRSALIEAAERQLDFQRLQLEAQTAQLRLDVTQAYYGLQEADERLRIFRDSLAQAEQNLEDARALERAGVGTRFDVLQAEVEVANRQQDLINALRDQAVARRQLAQLLSIPQTVNLSAADPIEVAADWPLSLEESIVRAYRNRAELEQRLVEREISNNQRRAAIAQYGPQVAAFAQYSAQNRLNDEDNGFIDDYRIGLELRLNLFDGGAALSQARQQQVSTQIAEADFANTRDTVRFQVEQAYFSLLANDTNIETTTLNVERATESLRLARLRFQAGVGTQSDVLRAQTELTQAEVDRLNAILGYNQSLAELRRAVSNWPDNDLQDVP